MILDFRQESKIATAVITVGAFWLSLSFCPAAFCQSCCPEDDDTNFNLRRLESARLLTEQANRLREMTSVLSRWSTLLALRKETPHEDVEKGSVQETAVHTKISSENFQKLLLAYQDARRQYLQHKLLYDEHIAAYHRQAQQQGSLQQQNLQQQQQPSGGGVLVAPQLKRLTVKAQDACTALQQTEFALTTAEAQLVSTINYLSSIKGKAAAETYFQVWSNAQTMGGSLQRQVVDFGRDVLGKEQTGVDKIHELTQAAQRNGDFVQSRDIYAELQRNNALNNEETRRAHVHTMFAASALGIISSLSPLDASRGGITSADNSPLDQLISGDQIEKESQALENEYNSLQRQYSEMEQANPAHEGGRR